MRKVERRIFMAPALLSAGLALFAGCGRAKEKGSGSGGKGVTATGGTNGMTGGAAPSGSGGSVGEENGGGMGGGGTAGAWGGAVASLTFAISPTGGDRLYGVAYDARGSIYAVGQVANSVDATADVATVVAKFSPAGTPDATFGAAGFAVRNLATGTNGELCRGIAVQSTGKVVVAGTVEHPGATDARDRDIVVARFTPDGNMDATFGAEGIVTLDLSTGVVNGTAFSADSAWGLAVYPDDRLVLHGGQVRSGGGDTDFALIRLEADGTRDATFGTNGVVALDTLADGASVNASPRNVTILPGMEGVIGAGYQPVPGAGTRPVVWKVSDAGVVDATFGTNGVFSQSLLAVQTETYQAVVQPLPGGGYKLVTTGYGRQTESETTDLVSMRLTSSGVLDTTWGISGLVRIDVGGFGDNSRRVVVLPDGRIVLAGGGRATSADVDGLVALLKPDGQPDTAFAPGGWKLFDLGGPADFLWSVALSPDHRTLAFAGLKGVGNTPTPVSANDDAALLLLPIPQ